MPPVNAFWSLTMYEMPQSLLVANPINRYLINSPMLTSWYTTRTAATPSTSRTNLRARTRKPNWLPAPKGPFVVVHAPLLAEARRARTEPSDSAKPEEVSHP